eukprot:667679-Rhodomonas_salina.7
MALRPGRGSHVRVNGGHVFLVPSLEGTRVWELQSPGTVQLRGEITSPSQYYLHQGVGCLSSDFAAGSSSRCSPDTAFWAWETAVSVQNPQSPCKVHNGS